jgi:cell division protein FtsZ
MPNDTQFESISFDLPKNQSNVIKVIGVGGGGSNAINHMFKQGIKGVDFIICNTDAQALENSAVPNKIQLGVHLTEGLGAGANPEVGQQAAIESVPEIEKMLETNTKMIFITAGMGGGTGTGAAPIIAQLAKERDILTVGIVTIPFLFEGKVRQEQAIIGIERLRKHVDSLIVINNNKLREVYGNLGFKAGFSKADEVLATASRGIAEVITHHYTQNIDLRDAKTVLANSGTAIMGSATATGETRAKDAIIAALDSPLLNDNKITGAKNVLLLIVSGSDEITIDEIAEINDFIQNEAGNNANIIMGVGEEESLGNAVSVTIIATGFNPEQQSEIVNTEPKKIIHTLEDEQKNVFDLSQKKAIQIDWNQPLSESKKEEKIVFELEESKPIQNIYSTDYINNLEVSFEIISPKKDFDFVFTTPEIKNIKVIDPEFVVAKKQTTLSFDLPIPKSRTSNNLFEQEEILLFETSEKIKDIHVVDPVEFVAVTELSNEGIIKHSLEEFMDLETEKPNVKSKTANQENTPEELNLTLKSVDLSSQKIDFTPAFESVSPLEMTIEESMQIKANERIKKLKEFNYKFNNASKLDDLEKEPAYKRLGIDLTEKATNNGNSRTTLGTDSNDELQLRSNNSYLHDNVD